MKYFFIILFFYSCSRESKTADNNIIQVQSFSELPIIVKQIEKFVDSLHFGVKGKHKLIIKKTYKDEGSYLNEDSCFVDVLLFSKLANNWQLSDSLRLKNTALSGLETELKDFNNDGYLDVLYTSGVAARGANIIQTLLIFNPSNEKLIWVWNSEYYPNLCYNDKLTCIDALSFTGGLTTTFLKLESDSLIEFAEVDQRDGRIVVTTTNGKGDKMEINNIEDKGFEDFYRFNNYNPLR